MANMNPNARGPRPAVSAKSPAFPDLATAKVALSQFNSTTAAPVEVATVEAAPPSRQVLDSIIARTEDEVQTVEPDKQFIGQGWGGIYSKMLQGVPFLFASMPVFSFQDGKFGVQEVAHANVRFVDYTERTVGEVIDVTFTGAYLLNGLRNCTQNELVMSRVFTVAANPAMPILPSGGYPLMVRVYDVTKTDDTSEELPF